MRRVGFHLRRAYRFSRSVLRSKFVALTHSELWDACSAAISQRVLIAAAEWRTGIETRAKTPDTMCASRKVQVPDATRGKRKPKLRRQYAAGKRRILRTRTLEETSRLVE